MRHLRDLPRPRLVRVGDPRVRRRGLRSGPTVAILVGFLGTALVLVVFAWWRSTTAADRDTLAGTTVEAVDGLGTANARLTAAGLPPVAVDPTLAASATAAASVVGTPAPTSIVTVTAQAPSGRPTGYPVPGPTITVPGPTVTVTGPNGTVTVSSTVDRLVPGPTTTVERTVDRPVPGPTITVDRPVEVPVEVPVPGPTTTVEVPVPGPTVTVETPGPTVTVTETVTAPPPDPDPPQEEP